MLTKNVCLSISCIQIEGKKIENTSVSVASYSYSYSESDVESCMTCCVMLRYHRNLKKSIVVSPCLH